MRDAPTQEKLRVAEALEGLPALGQALAQGELAKVFSALRNLGFREGEVRAALRELQTDGALRDATFDRLLREALARLRPQRSPR